MYSTIGISKPFPTCKIKPNCLQNSSEITTNYKIRGCWDPVKCRQKSWVGRLPCQVLPLSSSSSHFTICQEPWWRFLCVYMCMCGGASFRGNTIPFTSALTNTSYNPRLGQTDASFASSVLQLRQQPSGRQLMNILKARIMSLLSFHLHIFFIHLKIYKIGSKQKPWKARWKNQQLHRPTVL